MLNETQIYQWVPCHFSGRRWVLDVMGVSEGNVFSRGNGCFEFSVYESGLTISGFTSLKDAALGLKRELFTNA